jgi:hypothetical protein
VEILARGFSGSMEPEISRAIFRGTASAVIDGRGPFPPHFGKSPEAFIVRRSICKSLCGFGDLMHGHRPQQSASRTVQRQGTPGRSIHPARWPMERQSIVATRGTVAKGEMQDDAEIGVTFPL